MLAIFSREYFFIIIVLLTLIYIILKQGWRKYLLNQDGDNWFFCRNKNLTKKIVKMETLSIPKLN